MDGDERSEVPVSVLLMAVETFSLSISLRVCGPTFAEMDGDERSQLECNLWQVKLSRGGQVGKVAEFQHS